ncbi:MAG: flavin reductase, partial [Campylobacterales bacterium]
MILDFSGVDETKIYKVMSYSIFPRPIAWVVTEDEGIVNIAPFSYFAPLSSNPPIVVVSIGLKEDESPKDTRANILKHKKATICLA